MINTAIIFIAISVILFGVLLGVVLSLISLRKQKQKNFILLNDFCSNTIPSKFPNEDEVSIDEIIKYRRIMYGINGR